ncbi:MAG: redoxin domain-containing protein [Candidatus Kapabacteria bacterium]|nr:redoxin domain-containing protein [Candidatus Kapabacteria bacterium]
MKKIILIFLIFAFFTNIASTKEPVSVIGKVVENFVLKNTENKYISLLDFKQAKGFIVIFTCNHCPFAKLYKKRLNDLNSKNSKLGVPLIAINPMDSLIYEDECLSDMKKVAKAGKYNFNYLQDATQNVANMFGASHTPQAFVIWKEDDLWIIKYSGAIDDNGEHPEKANSFIANAVNELLANSIVSTPETKSFGCSIYYRKK